MILSPVFLKTDLVLHMFSMIISVLIVLLLIFAIPAILIRIKTEDMKTIKLNRAIRNLKFSVPIFLFLLLISSFVLWYFMYRVPFGSDEGISGFIFFRLILSNLIPFISICGIFLLQRKKLFEGRNMISISNDKDLLILSLVYMIGCISTLIPNILMYLQNTDNKIISSNFLFYYISIISSISLIILLFYIKKGIKNIEEKNVSNSS
jgi:hypothetical protein